MAWRWSSTDFLLNAPFNCRLPKISIVRYWMQTAVAISAVFRDATAAGKQNKRDAEKSGERDAHRPNETELSGRWRWRAFLNSQQSSLNPQPSWYSGQRFAPAP